MRLALFATLLTTAFVAAPLYADQPDKPDKKEKRDRDEKRDRKGDADRQEIYSGTALRVYPRLAAALRAGGHPR